MIGDQLPTTSDSVDIERVLVILPTYNERGNIGRIVERISESQGRASMLIVDDRSPDGTGQLADAIAAANPRVHVLHRPVKAGLGAAYIAGFSWGLAAGYEVLVEMDADGSHAPEQLWLLLDRLSEADLVLGSRWVAGGRVLNWPRSRELLSRAGNLYARVALGIELRDATGGYRAFRREVLEQIDFADAASQGYCFQVDLAWRTIAAGFRVAEVPIDFSEREVGESKMSSAIVREALVRVTQWGIAYRGGQLRHGSASLRRLPRALLARLGARA